MCLIRTLVCVIHVASHSLCCKIVCCLLVFTILDSSLLFHFVVFLLYSHSLTLNLSFQPLATIPSTATSPVKSTMTSRSFVIQMSSRHFVMEVHVRGGSRKLNEGGFGYECYHADMSAYAQISRYNLQRATHRGTASLSYRGESAQVKAKE